MPQARQLPPNNHHGAPGRNRRGMKIYPYYEFDAFPERHHLNPGWIFLLAAKNFLAASLPDAAMEFKATWS